MIKNYIAKTIYSQLIKKFPYSEFKEKDKSILKTQISSYLTNAYAYGIFYEDKKPVNINLECSYSAKLISFITLQSPSFLFLYTNNENRKKGLASSLICHVHNISKLQEIIPYGFCQDHFKALKKLVNKLKIPAEVKINTGYKLNESI